MLIQAIKIHKLFRHKCFCVLYVWNWQMRRRLSMWVLQIAAAVESGLARSAVVCFTRNRQEIKARYLPWLLTDGLATLHKLSSQPKRRRPRKCYVQSHYEYFLQYKQFTTQATIPHLRRSPGGLKVHVEFIPSSFNCLTINVPKLILMIGWPCIAV